MLEYGKESIAENEKVRHLLDSIIYERKQKVSNGLSDIREKTILIRFNNMTMAELNVSRPFILKSVEILDNVDIMN